MPKGAKKLNQDSPSKSLRAVGSSTAPAAASEEKPTASPVAAASPSPAPSSMPSSKKTAEGLIAQGAAENVLQFRSPVYAAKWLDDRHCVVGGGGDRRFGMTNGLALLAVAPTDASKELMAADVLDAPDLWRLAGSLDLRKNIVWLMSNVEDAEPNPNAPKSGGEPTRTAYFCVSHLDSFTLVEAAGLRAPTALPEPRRTLGAPRLRKVCRVGLDTEDPTTGDPEKKPVAIAGGLVFAAQDNATVAVFRLDALLANPPASPPSASPEKKAAAAAPAAQAEGDNDSFAAMASASAPADAMPLTITVGGRVNDMSARASPWDPKVVFLTVLCKDKTASLIEVDAESGTVKHTAVLTGTNLGFEGQTLMRNSLRQVTSFEQQLPLSEKLAAPERGVGSGWDDPPRPDGESPDRDSEKKVAKAKAPTSPARPRRETRVNIVFLLLSFVDGFTYAQRIIIKKGATKALVEKPLKVHDEVPTAVSLCRVYGPTFTHIVVATADGHVHELRDRHAKALSIARRRKALHNEPISAIAMHPHGGVVSADIAQRVVISHAGGVAKPREESMRLFAESRFAVLRAGGKALKTREAAMAIAVLVALIAVAAQLLGWSSQPLI